MNPWRATHAHLRAAVAGFGLLVAGLVLGRTDVVLLAAPLALIALAGQAARPQETPTARATEGVARARHPTSRGPTPLCHLPTG